MGGYDAFGRKVGEDTLEGLGAHSQGAATPASVESAAAAKPATREEQPTVTASSDPVATPPPSGADVPEFDLPIDAQKVGRGFIRLIGVFVALVALGVIGSVGWSLSDTKDPADFDIDVPGITIPGLTFVTPPPETPAAPANPSDPAELPHGLERRSLIRAGEFSRALTGLRSRGLGQITNLRVAADRINVQLRTRDGRLRNVQIDPGRRVREISLSGPGFGHIGTMAYGDIDTDAPQRLARAAARRRGVSPTRVDYLVVLDLGGEIVWSLFFKNGKQFQADAAGRITRAV